MDNAVNKSLFGVVIVIILLSGGGCRENAGRLHEKARKAFVAANQEEAIQLFNKVLDMDSNNLAAHFYLGWIYETQGRIDDGITEFGKAIEISPNNEGSYLHLGDLYRAKGMLDESLEAFNKVIILNPDSAAGHYKLGIAYRQKGKSAEAADALFEAGLLAVINNNKDLALNAYKNLNETGNTQLAVELQGVLSPWFDPANEVVTQPQHSQSQQ